MYEEKSNQQSQPPKKKSVTFLAGYDEWCNGDIKVIEVINYLFLSQGLFHNIKSTFHTVNGPNNLRLHRLWVLR